MVTIPAKVYKRLATAIPKFRKILLQASKKDVNEADTVTIVADMLEEIFGFDRYSEITREYAIRGTYCDLAIKSERKIKYLVEVKSIGTSLKDVHLRQAIDYAAKEGVEWVVLTNGMVWDVYKVKVDGKVSDRNLFTINFEEVNLRNDEHQAHLFSLCKRGVQRGVMKEISEHKESVNRYIVGAIIQSEQVVSIVRRKVREESGIKVEEDTIRNLIRNEVIKREVLESEDGRKAEKRMRRQQRAKEKSKVENKSGHVKGEHDVGEAQLDKGMENPPMESPDTE